MKKLLRPPQGRSTSAGPKTATPAAGHKCKTAAFNSNTAVFLHNERLKGLTSHLLSEISFIIYVNAIHTFLNLKLLVHHVPENPAQWYRLSHCLAAPKKQKGDH